MKLVILFLLVFSRDLLAGYPELRAPDIWVRTIYEVKGETGPYIPGSSSHRVTRNVEDKSLSMDIKTNWSCKYSLEKFEPDKTLPNQAFSTAAIKCQFLEGDEQSVVSRSVTCSEFSTRAIEFSLSSGKSIINVILECEPRKKKKR